MKKLKNAKIGVFAVVALVLVTVAVYLYVPTMAEQPGSAGDPLVTRRYVDERVAQMEEEITILRNIVANLVPGVLPDVPQQPLVQATPGITQADRDALMAEIMHYFETVYGARLNEALGNIPGPGWEPRVVPFTVLVPQAGQVITFDAGAEFILRGGSATAVTGINGIPDVTAGADVMNGQTIGLNHLMMIPVTDGRGIAIHEESWVMVRGGYTISG